MIKENGRIIPETEDQKLREIIVQGYRVMYRLEVDRILILAIMHGSLGLAEKETKPWEEN
ncbi:MAG: type II toxin-antitoxin system RelE/ParE family toxin [Nitrosomonas sp.]|uniref:type II toxin-antitoxin system RelE/ParE family toxin n=1 Tax=Nitrosomonas sp. TaxID=42353 RepID=UPI001DF3FB45|nr:type II toxin-antitoxin system RelE/ParE family toxin [Nitrosomonas sp.]